MQPQSPALMLFNSTAFLLFLPIVFILYWFVTNKSLKLQNILIFVSSYLFYGWWDWRFLSLLAISSIIDYYASLRMEATDNPKIRKRWLWLSMCSNLGILGFFKYYNFFVNSWVEAWGSLGYHIDPWTVQVILPVGISFYTFQTMSYTIDVYRRQLKATNDFIAFSAFISFFPQLVAGPIERATNLLPQMLQKRKFSYAQATDGLRLILWGMFKKVVIADTLAIATNRIFGGYENYSGGALILGVVYFAFQIYTDFSGYSDIARGCAKLFGFELMLNFNFPYFSRNIAEFWRRWHISLSTWFRDYLYIPLGGSRVSKPKAIRNVFIIFLVSGFWHGANWTFIIWGGIHAMLFIPSFIIGTHRKHITTIAGEGKWLPSPIEFGQMLLTFCFATLAWVFFRAETVSKAFDYIGRMNFDFNEERSSLYYVLIIVVCDWVISHRLLMPAYRLKLVRYVLYIVLLFAIIYHTGIKDAGNQFIYFNF